MKDSEIYLRAAEVIADGVTECSCDAISHVSHGEWRFPSGEARCGEAVQKDRYAELFAPNDGGFIWGDLWANDFAGRQSCRVLALLFMHQIALDEEREQAKRRKRNVTKRSRK